MVDVTNPVADRLSGWKEIGHYLRRSVRSVQRWERDLKLPIKRVKTANGQVVFASRAELDAWMSQSGQAGADGQQVEAVGGLEDAGAGNPGLTGQRFAGGPVDAGRRVGGGGAHEQDAAAVGGEVGQLGAQLLGLQGDEGGGPGAGEHGKREDREHAGAAASDVAAGLTGQQAQVPAVTLHR